MAMPGTVIIKPSTAAVSIQAVVPLSSVGGGSCPQAGAATVANSAHEAASFLFIET